MRRSAVLEMFGAHQNVNGSRDLTKPLSGMVCHPGLALANLQNLKFLTPLTTKISKAIQNVEKWSGLW